MNTAKYDIDAQIFEKEHHDNCSICGRHFDDDEHTTLGFNKYKRLQYAGICCRTQIDEIIICHSYQKRCYTVPEKSNKLWRFMDLSKFISLLSGFKRLILWTLFLMNGLKISQITQNKRSGNL